MRAPHCYVAVVPIHWPHCYAVVVVPVRRPHYYAVVVRACHFDPGARFGLGCRLGLCRHLDIGCLGARRQYSTSEYCRCCGNNNGEAFHRVSPLVDCRGETAIPVLIQEGDP